MTYIEFTQISLDRKLIISIPDTELNVNKRIKQTLGQSFELTFYVKGSPWLLYNEEIIMTTYNKQFELSIKDVDLIERSMRFHISHLAHTETSSQTKESIENHNKIIELMGVLSTFHNQKIWYSQTHRTGVPLG